jgi:hypothetical protein
LLIDSLGLVVGLPEILEEGLAERLPLGDVVGETLGEALLLYVTDGEAEILPEIEVDGDADRLSLGLLERLEETLSLGEAEIELLTEALGLVVGEPLRLAAPDPLTEVVGDPLRLVDPKAPSRISITTRFAAVRSIRPTAVTLSKSSSLIVTDITFSAAVEDPTV